jgi:hypothetical protein
MRESDENGGAGLRVLDGLSVLGRPRYRHMSVLVNSLSGKPVASSWSGAASRAVRSRKRLRSVRQVGFRIGSNMPCRISAVLSLGKSLGEPL